MVCRIVGAGVSSDSKTWEDLVLLPELNAVFGEDASVNVQHLNAQRFEHDGLFAVTYYPLAMHIDRRLAADVNYFENEHADLTPHDLVILGGTFDHLHNGHKKLLSLAVGLCANRMIVGVTADRMLRRKVHAELLEPLEKRKCAVRAYIAFLNPTIMADIVTINDPFGPAIVVPEAAAMVVSTETLSGAAKINSIRVGRGLPKLHIFACRRTESSTLSSSCIRAKIAASRSH
uniref:Cytidyltransferase-like domain-containing protein n=1 Tax=Hyaloperonospora arabidopsidis (strain Emoy2) TaxID=559515 RepID=M4BIL4_HYAAE